MHEKLPQAVKRIIQTDRMPYATESGIMPFPISQSEKTHNPLNTEEQYSGRSNLSNME